MKFNQKFENIVIDRLSKQNSELSKKISEKLQETANRGIYLSGITINDVLDIILNNIDKIKETICDTAFEVHRAYCPNEGSEEVEQSALNIFGQQKTLFLSKRADSISKILEELKLDPGTGISKIENGFFCI